MSAPSSLPSRTTWWPSTSTCRAWRSGPRTSPASGSSTSARSSSGQTTRSARWPGSRRPTSSRPRQRSPPSVAGHSPSAGRKVVELRSRWRARNRAMRSSGSSPPISLLATPSTPSPTGAPAAVRSTTRATPHPSRQLLEGQWAIPGRSRAGRRRCAPAAWCPRPRGSGRRGRCRPGPAAGRGHPGRRRPAVGPRWSPDSSLRAGAVSFELRYHAGRARYRARRPEARSGRRSCAGPGPAGRGRPGRRPAGRPRPRRR
jgi:hypothetical protein